MIRKKELYQISHLDKSENQQFEVGKFIEAYGNASPPAIENWLSRMQQLIGFIDRNLSLFGQSVGKASKGRRSDNISKNQIASFKGMMGFLEDYIGLTRQDPGKIYLRVQFGNESRGVWCGLSAESILVPLATILPSDVKVLGRIEKILKKDEVYKLVDFTNFNSLGSLSPLLDMLNGIAPILNQKPIVETDLQAIAPEFFVTPIAIYR